MSEPRILVIGEKFIDRYYVGTATRLSPEAPIPVVAVKEVIQSAGGAGNVYQNLLALGAKAMLYGPGHEPIKNRLIANGQQLARWDENDTIPPIQFLKPEDFQDVNGVIISDYGKGGFNSQNLRDIRTLMNTCKVPHVFVDTKRDPDDISFYPAQTFFFPNMKEFREHEQSYYETHHVIRTESENGMTYIEYGQARIKQPTLAKNVVSVCGAGDTAIAAFAYAYCKESNIPKAMLFASKACAVVCAKPYTAVASHEEINKIRG